VADPFGGPRVERTFRGSNGLSGHYQRPGDVAAELPRVRHPVLHHVVRSLDEALEHGSFYEIMEAYKAVDADLIEQVQPVRK
jgi:hypothetical protein